MKRTEETMLYREISVDASAVNAESREVALAFSSEKPVERWDWETGQKYLEVLDHSPGNADFSRLNNGGAFLVNHDTDEQVGAVKKGTAVVGADRIGRAVVRLSRSDDGEEILQDMRDEIRTLVSFGYRTTKELSRETKDGMEIRRYAFQALEISTVPIPADETVGVGRSETPANPTQTSPKKSETMEANTPAAPVATPNLEVREDAAKNERSRIREINAIAERLEGKVNNIRKMAQDAIDSGTALDAFRASALGSLPTVQPAKPAEPMDVKPRDWERYSLTRALRMQLPGSKRDGIENELSEEISLKGGLRSEGLWVPREAMVMAGQRNYVAGTNTLGGFLVQTSNLGSQFVELLRNRAKTQMLGARMLNLSNPVTIPRQNGAGSVNWVGETVAATLSTGNFTQLTLTPNGLSAFQQYGKQLLFESDPSIDALLRDDIMNIIALEIDRVVLHGTGSSQPTGITATTGVTTIALGTNGAAFSVANGRASVVSLETAVATSNADVGSLAYLTNAKMRGRLKMIDQNLATTAADWVWKGGASGEVNGYRAEVSNQVSAIQTQGTATTICSSVFFGNWNDVLIASFNNGATDLVVDPYTLAANGVVRVIARHWADIGIRHPASFSVLLGALDS